MLSLHTRSRSSDDGPRLLITTLPSVYCCRRITRLCCSFACRGKRSSRLPLFSPITSYYRHRRRRFSVSTPFGPGATSSARLHPTCSSPRAPSCRLRALQHRLASLSPWRTLFFLLFLLPRLRDACRKPCFSRRDWKHCSPFCLFKR